MEGVKASMLEALNKQRADWTARYEELKASGAKSEEFATEFKAHQRRLDEVEAILRRPNGTFGEVPPVAKSLGQLLVESEQMKAFASSWHKGTAGLNFEKPIFERNIKTLIDSTAVGSSIPGILVPERVGGIVKPPQRRLRVRDLIPFTTTGNNAVEFIKETLFTNAASVVEEGAEKPESSLTFEIEHADVQTIAHWIPATRQILDDFAQLQAYIDTRLLDGLADTEDSQLLSGSGVGHNLNGIYTQATSVVGTYAQAGDTYIDQIARALTEMGDDHYWADGIVLNPADWMTILTIKTEDGGANTGGYLMGGPGSLGTPTLWGKPVVQTDAMEKGKFLVGQFTGSVFGFDRMRAQIAVSTDHDDYFIKNKVAIRAEERITVAVFRPAAFRKGTFS
jgi:HK97 family phage major capsid protein